MSEEVKEAPQGKKKGKLPVIIALVALIGGGGFFGMKMKSGGPKKVEIKAGAPEPLDKEFLVNLTGQNSSKSAMASQKKRSTRQCPKSVAASFRSSEANRQLKWRHPKRNPCERRSLPRSIPSSSGI
jgi:hypothetical protein